MDAMFLGLVLWWICSSIAYPLVCESVFPPSNLADPRQGTYLASHRGGGGVTVKLMSGSSVVAMPTFRKEAAAKRLVPLPFSHTMPTHNPKQLFSAAGFGHSYSKN